MIKADTSVGVHPHTSQESKRSRQRRETPGHQAADDAFAEIYRRHRGAVLAYARACCRDAHTAEDLSAEAFTQTLQAVRAGAGPHAAWRPYLLSVVRRTAAQWMSTGRRIELSQDFHSWIEMLPSPGSNAEQELLEREDHSLVLQAFKSLSERWQLVLWHTAVERESSDVVGLLLGISPSGVSSLAQRAREGLREAYLQVHLAHMDNEHCRPFTGLLAAAVRRSGVRRSKAFERHIDQCPQCATALTELEDINERLWSTLPAGLSLWGPDGNPPHGPLASTGHGQDERSASHLPETTSLGDALTTLSDHAEDSSHRGSGRAASRAMIIGIVVIVAIIGAGPLLMSSGPPQTSRIVSTGQPPTIPPALAPGSIKAPQAPLVSAASGGPATTPDLLLDVVGSGTASPNNSNLPGPYLPGPTLSAAPSRSASSSPKASGTVNRGPSTTLPKTNWSLVYVDSQDTEGTQATNAFDGDPASYWHTTWYFSEDPLPHEIQIDLGATYDVDGLKYLPRQDGGTNGTIGDYTVYVSKSTGQWGSPVAGGSFQDTPGEKAITFGARTGRYLRLVALTEAGSRGPWTSAAEISLTGRPPL
ncbi:sigma-70 family RNA polymerase sigma factor [Streptomyces sp. NBC_00879]|uniref:sigma-70 family RNA polymerase sigma factor n=1 Tax=Streptomyces sp. NBC_00879 TaxID=2975855 RepID=UPI003863DE82|nr:sigma-70 family RNA polymerase sigma factor [Streptomyces sp. NBC_00879]